jgi:hypothetical protein
MTTMLLDAIKLMKEWPIINQLICSKIGKLLLQWKSRKSSSMVWTRIIAMTSEVEPAYYYRYAQSLRSISEMTQIKSWKFDQISGNDRGDFAKTKIMDAIKANSRYKIEDAGINSPYSDYGTTIYANKIVFASARDTGSLGHRDILGPVNFTNCMWQM